MIKKKQMTICLSEVYYDDGENYISQSVSYNFFNGFDELNTMFLSPVNRSTVPQIHTNKNSMIPKEKFIELPFFDSIKSFAKGFYFNKNYRRDTINKYKHAIDKSEIIWARNPSLASVIFSEMALKNNKKLISHICADIDSTWQIEKYKGINKLFAFLIAKFILYKLKKISSHHNTYTLCTGQLIYNQFKNFNRNVILFTDSIIKKEELKIKKTIDNTFIYVGRLNKEKGLYELIDACKILVNKQISFHLDIIGFGELENDIMLKLNEYNLGLYVSFVGSLEHDKIRNYYERNSILVIPSYREGFPRVILEAWSYGMPVICTNVGGISTYGLDKKNVYFVEVKNSNSLANAMIELIKNDILKSSMKTYIQNNREMVTIEYQQEIVHNILKKL